MGRKIDLDLSQGFSAGNYAGAYETEDIDEALNELDEEGRSRAYEAGFILGFFSAYDLSEIPGSDRPIYDDAYWSKYGKRVLKLGYIDSRQEEYEEEAEF